MPETVKWGVVGLGSIANRVLKGIQGEPTAKVVAAGSRNLEKARAFCSEHHVPRAYGSYEAVLEDPEVELVYVALPNHLHAEWTMKAAAAGKHVLCEKPFAMNLAEAKRVVSFCRKKGVFLMEAFMYRCHPQMAKLREIIHSGRLGEVRVINAGFSYGGINEDNCRMMLSEGGGGLMDVGCYPISFARMVAGSEPVECRAVAVVGARSRVDHWAAGVMRFKSGLLAHFDCGMMVHTDWSAQVFGTKGKARVLNPWVPEAGTAVIEVTDFSTWKTEKVEVPCRHIFAHEAEAVARSLASHEAPEMTWPDTLGNMRALDLFRESMGLRWPGEGPRRPQRRRGHKRKR
jgi:predicted dehydrogenase